MRNLLLVLCLMPLHAAASPIYQYSFSGDVVGTSQAINFLDGIELGSPFRARLGFELDPVGCSAVVAGVCVTAYSQASFGRSWFELPVLGGTLLRTTTNPEVISLVLGSSPGLLTGAFGDPVASSFSATLLGLPMGSTDEWLAGLGLYDHAWGATNELLQVEHFSSGSFAFTFFVPDPATPGSWLESDLNVRLTGLVAVPEPSVLGLALIGLIGAGWRRIGRSGRGIWTIGSHRGREIGASASSNRYKLTCEGCRPIQLP